MGQGHFPGGVGRCNEAFLRAWLQRLLVAFVGDAWGRAANSDVLVNGSAEGSASLKPSDGDGLFIFTPDTGRVFVRTYYLEETLLNVFTFT